MAKLTATKIKKKSELSRVTFFSETTERVFT